MGAKILLSNRFEGDNNQILKDVQSCLFESLIRWLFKACKSEYLKAIDYVGIETELSKELRTTYPSEFQSLREAYEIIATYFRYLHENSGQLILPTLVSGCEDLDPTEATKIYYTREWSEFWYEETKRLSEERNIILTILEIYTFPNSNQGEELHKKLSALLLDRYNAKISESDM